MEVGALIKFLEKIARQNLLDQDDVLAWQLIARRNELRCSSTCDEQQLRVASASRISRSPNLVLVLSRRCGRTCSTSHFRLRRSRATASERAIVRATHRATSQIFINILTSYAVLFRMRSRFARKIDVVNQSTSRF